MNFADRTFELKEIETLRGHTDNRVCCIAWNPATGVDDVPAMIASCGADKNVLIWEQNIATGSFQCKQKLQDMYTVIWCAWVASGSLLVTSSIDGLMCIWKSFEGRFRIMNGFGRADKLPSSFSLNASGELIAICTPQKKIWIWKRASILDKNFEHASKVADSKGYAKMIQWHPLKDILFSCGFDNTIKIWVPDADMVNWDCMQTLGESNSGRKHTIQALAFNGRGNKIVACSDDLSINIWSIDIGMMRYGERNSPGTHLCTLTGYHDQTFFSVHWSREEIICTGAADGALCFIIESEDGPFDEPSYKLLLKKDHAHDEDINSVQWCPQDNSRLASASDDGTIKIWELASLPRF